mmetsp:Transcript_29536/g.52865  ORF Transcript_29536/g.52865 Transcript_29536/m.52865 type:complete len:210 (+) Transcript_29536:236-865(+)
MTVAQSFAMTAVNPPTPLSAGSTLRRMASRCPYRKGPPAGFPVIRPFSGLACVTWASAPNLIALQLYRAAATEVSTLAKSAIAAVRATHAVNAAPACSRRRVSAQAWRTAATAAPVSSRRLAQRAGLRSGHATSWRLARAAPVFARKMWESNGARHAQQAMVFLPRAMARGVSTASTTSVKRYQLKSPSATGTMKRVTRMTQKITRALA